VRRLTVSGAALIVVALLSGCGGAPPTPGGTPAVTLTLVASNLAFDQTQLAVPADATFAITLDNRDASPHNVNISGTGVSRETEPFGGPATKTYVYAGLPAGSYTFLCAVHPDMKGTLVSGGS
jgi:plastocyanin